MHSPRTTLTAALALALVALTTWARTLDQRRPATPLHAGRLAPQALEDGPAQDQPPVKGHAPRTDEDVVGTSYFDFQHNGSLGKMIAVSSDGVAHGVYTGGLNVTTGRRAMAWCRFPDGTIVGPAMVVDETSRFTTCAVTSADPPNTLQPLVHALGYHSNTGSWLAFDYESCALAFGLLQQSDVDILWPHVAVDYQDRTHMVCGGYQTDAVWYTATTSGDAWDDDYIMVADSCNTLAAMCTAAKHAPGAAVLFAPDAPATPPIFYDATYGAPQWHHDVCLFEARDAENDLFAQIEEGQPLNLTRYNDPASTAPFRWGVFAYCDIDAIYDAGDTPGLHVAFTTPVSYVDSLICTDLRDDVTDVAEFAHVDLHSAIWITNPATGAWSHVGGRLTGDSEADDLPYPFAGVFRVKEDRVQLAHDPDTGHLYAMWNVFDKHDLRDPAPDGKAMANGELFMACSADEGLTWGPRVNITNTPTPGCLVGECRSETYATLAETVNNGRLHITYMQDLHAGSSIRNSDGGDGSVQTENDIVYLDLEVVEVPPYGDTPWDAEGHIGLSHYNSLRGLVWTDGAPDSAICWDRVCIFNEGRETRHLRDLRLIHDPLDEFGTENLWMEWEVKPGDPLSGGDFIRNPSGDPDSPAHWDGALPPWSVTQVHLGVGRRGYPLREHAFRFEFSDGTVRDYRYQYYGPGGVGSLVETIDMEHLEQYQDSLFFTDIRPPERPRGLILEPNAPNPFNPSTEISFVLERPSTVRLGVHNLRGETVAVLVDGPRAAGRHAVLFDGGGLASGVYLCTLEADGRREAMKMLLVK